MCELWSCIVSQTGQVYSLPDSNSHDEIATRFNLPDREHDPDKMEWTRVEITPPLDENDRANHFADPATWRFEIDDSIIPTWWNDGYRAIAYEALKEFCAKRYVTVENDGEYENAEDEPVEIRCYAGRVYAHKNAKVEAFDSARIYALDGSKVEARAGSHVSAANGSVVTAWGGSYVRAESGSVVYGKYEAKISAGRGSDVRADTRCIVTARDGSLVTVIDDATVFAESGSHVFAYDHAHVYADSMAFVEATKTVHLEQIDAGAICIVDGFKFIIGKNTEQVDEPVTIQRLSKFNADKTFARPEF